MTALAVFQVLPCLHPPGVHVVVYDPSGGRVYDDIIKNRTVIPLEDLDTSIIIDVKDGDGVIGIKVS